MSVELYNDIMDNADYWKQYIRSETADAVADVWQDAKPLIYNFLDDLKWVFRYRANSFVM